MKRFEKFILKSCAYAVLILTLFFLFTLATSFTEAAIKIGTFMLILLFGVVISTADLIFCIESVSKALRLLIHYGSLLLTFIVVFVFSGNISSSGGGAVISAIFIFTVLYAILFLIIYLIKKSVGKADQKLDKRVPKKVKEVSSYKSLYGKNEK